VTVVTTEGQYGLLACYGDDPDTPADEGAAPGETIRLVVAGQTVGTGTWLAQGERQWTPLGKVTLWRTYLPSLEHGASAVTPESQRPAERPPVKHFLPFVGETQSEANSNGKEASPTDTGGQPTGTPSPAPATPEPVLTPGPTRSVQQPARRRKSAGG
jgi:hypothetical protein